MHRWEWERMHAHSLSSTPLWPRRCCKSLIHVWVGLIWQTSKAELPITRACRLLHNLLDSTPDPDGANKGLKTHCESLSWREWKKEKVLVCERKRERWKVRVGGFRRSLLSLSIHPPPSIIPIKPFCHHLIETQDQQCRRKTQGWRISKIRASLF